MMPMPKPTTGGAGNNMPAPAEPHRALVPGAPDPKIQLWKNETSGRWLATLNYNGVWTHTVRATRDLAFDDCLQFYMTHTLEGQNNSEVVS